MAVRARSDELIVEELGEELLIYDVARQRAHSLNSTAAAVFRLADGKRSTEEMAGLAGVDEQAVLLALAELDRCHLLDEAPDPSVISRRTALRRAAIAGGALGVGLPIIRSIAAPSMAQAQSACVDVGGACTTTSECCSGASQGGNPYVCKHGSMCCPCSSDTSCTNDSQCCPGSSCSSDNHLCEPNNGRR
jgi:hypothetical protein